MNDLIKLYQSLLTRYKVDFILFGLALITTCVSLLLLVIPQANASPAVPLVTKTQTIQKKQDSAQYITVDIQGAVKKPDAYNLVFGARIKDILKVAGGLSTEADSNFFARNFNLAQKLSDEQKLYVPSRSDITNELISSAGNATLSQSDNLKANNSNKIDLNSAQREQLDNLPGIGTVTADKIINARPFTSTDELLSNKIVNQSTYEKIKDLVTVI